MNGPRSEAGGLHGRVATSNATQQSGLSSSVAASGPRPLLCWIRWPVASGLLASLCECPGTQSWGSPSWPGSVCRSCSSYSRFLLRACSTIALQRST